LRPCIRRDSHPTLTRPRLRHDPHSQQRLRRFLHDPKSLTPAPTQKRNVNIRHVSRENIRRNPPRLIFAEQLGRRPPPWLFFEIDISELLPVVIQPYARCSYRKMLF
jgi:hypothetical protein